MNQQAEMALLAGVAFGAGVGLTCLLQPPPPPPPPPPSPPPSSSFEPPGMSPPAQRAASAAVPALGLSPGPALRERQAESDADVRSTSVERERRSSVSSAESLSPRSPTAPAQFAPLEGVFGVDIGGTLAKLVFLEKLTPLPGGVIGSREDRLSATSLRNRKRRSNFITARERFGSTGQRYTDLEFPCAQLGGVLHFIKFETRRLDSALKIVQDAGLLHGMARVYMGGGGAFKYQAKIEQELGVVCVPVDEFEALVWGIDYVLQHGPQNEVYTIAQPADTPHVATAATPSSFPSPSPLPRTAGSRGGQGGDEAAGTAAKKVEVYVSPASVLSQPYLVVNIGSGVSFLKVRPLASGGGGGGSASGGGGGGNSRFERCGGTALGGATFWGLARLITDASTFEEAMELCRQGDADQVDKLVKDIYGGDYERVGLKGEVCASSFGKLSSMADPKKEARQEDLCLALLKMITAQITNLAANIAKLHHIDRIFFVGGFLRFNEISRPQIAHFCRRFFDIQALFLRHADFLGAIGALDEASRDQGFGLEQTRLKGQPSSPRLRPTTPQPSAAATAARLVSRGSEAQQQQGDSPKSGRGGAGSRARPVGHDGHTDGGGSAGRGALEGVTPLAMDLDLGATHAGTAAAKGAAASRNRTAAAGEYGGAASSVGAVGPGVPGAAAAGEVGGMAGLMWEEERALRSPVSAAWGSPRSVEPATTTGWQWRNDDDDDHGGNDGNGNGNDDGNEEEEGIGTGSHRHPPLPQRPPPPLLLPSSLAAAAERAPRAGAHHGD